jgi:hypothetical protein
METWRLTPPSSPLGVCSEITHPNVCLFLGACFGSDHEILTSDGFLRLDDVLQRVSRDAAGRVVSWNALKVANYDPVARHIVYDEPCALVVKRSAELVRFAAADAAVDVMATRDHDLFVAPAHDEHGAEFAKLKAKRAAKLDALRFLAHAPNGVVADKRDCAALTALTASLALTPPQWTAFLELYGVWVAAGSLRSCGGDPQLPAGPFVAERLAALACHQRGASCGAGFVSVRDERLRRIVAAAAAAAAASLAPWCWSLGAQEARSVVAGLTAGGAQAVRVAGERLRDDVVRLALHAGFAASAEWREGAWCVAVELESAGARPLVRRGVDCVGAVKNPNADERVWCFAMPQRAGGRVSGVGGFVTTRRVTAAAVSRPTIQGNCFDSEVMLVTELLEGDLTSLMQSDFGKSMSLYQKVTCARDIASGMAWLHHIQVVHLDLKPTNILYDSNRRMKVADFGLARFKSEDGYVPGACGGTPLYSAPEVLMKEDFTDKADVYSFALIFSYVLSGHEPFTGFTVWDDFFHAVVTKGQRPQLAPAVPKRIRRLIESCWAFDPDVRPSFIEILAILELALLDAAIEDPLGRRIWKTYFFDTKAYEHCTINRLISSVAWDDFMRMLETMLFIPDGPIELPSDLVDQPLGMTPTDSQLYLAPDERLFEYSRVGGDVAQRRVDNEIERRNRVVELQCLKTLLCKDLIVKVERFGLICKLFGPVLGEADDQGGEMLGRIADVMNQTWFHGDMSSTEAYTVLRDKKPGAFLVRFSSSQAAFCISSVVSKSSKPATRAISNGSSDDDDGLSPPPNSAAAANQRRASLDFPKAADKLLADGAWSGSTSSPSAVKKSRPRVEDLQELDAVVHVTIVPDANGAFRYPGSEQSFKTIVDLVQASNMLTRPCPVSKKRFGYIFSSLRASHFGYIDNDIKSRRLFTTGLATIDEGDEKEDSRSPPPATAAPANHKSHHRSRSERKGTESDKLSRPSSTEPVAAPAVAAKPPVPSKPPPGVPAAASISSNSRGSPDVKRQRSTGKKSKSSSALTGGGDQKESSKK